MLDRKKPAKEIKRVSEQYGLSVDPDAYVRDISVGMEQRVEILKHYTGGADVLIFDEPTAVLTPQEIEELIVIMRGLVREGKSIILITHKLDEIKAVADRCTVIRRGKRNRYSQCQRRNVTAIGRYDGWSFCFLQNTENLQNQKKSSCLSKT